MFIYKLLVKIGEIIINFFAGVGARFISLVSFIFYLPRRLRNKGLADLERNPFFAFLIKTGDVTIIIILMPFRFFHHFNRIVIHGGKKVAVKRRTGNKILDAIILFHYNTVSWLEKLDDVFYYKYIHKKDSRKKYRSLTGWVESKGEKRIANWLYLNGIKSVYEKKLYLPRSNKTYRPDFYLPKYKVYIEFFGMEGAYDYSDRRKTKEKCYRRENIKYIGLFPSDVKSMERLGDIIKERFSELTGKTLKTRRWKNDYLKWL